MKNNSPNLPENADPLDALLRDADEYLPDNGFTARVVQKLPARRNRHWLRLMLLSTAMLLGVGLAAWQSPAMFAIFSGSLNLPSLLHWQTVVGLVPLLAALGSLVWVVFAVANEED
jgi:hypothetical protein